MRRRLDGYLYVLFKCLSLISWDIMGCVVGGGVLTPPVHSPYLQIFNDGVTVYSPSQLFPTCAEPQNFESDKQSKI